MKTNKIFSLVLAASMMAACTNEDVVNSNGIDGQMMDATNFSLVGVKGGEGAESRAAYLPQYVYAQDGSLVAGVVKPVWEANDQVGFTHIYPSDQKIVTNYKFEIEPAGVGTSNAATFKTTNSTIFAGDYFVYYPYNGEYCDYDGIPFELDAIQTQNASAAAIVKVGSISHPATDANKATLALAGDHLSKYRFSIANRIQAEPATSQANFALNQYTSTLAFLIYPANQTNTIHVQRIVMKAKEGKTLEIPTKVLFNAVAGQAAPVAAVDKKANEAVLLFDNVEAGGLAIDEDGTKNTATLAYLSMIPNTYAKEDFEFVVYYSENNIMKKRIVDTYKDLTLTSNSTTFFNIELDANKALQVVDNEIWSETEFASAVAKSNLVTNGAVTYKLMQDITLTKDYLLKSPVSVKFEGGKTITIAPTKKLQIQGDVEFENIIAGGSDANMATLQVISGEVSIEGVNSEYLCFVNDGETTILNETLTEGKLKFVNNTGDLTLANVSVAKHVQNGAGSDEATLALSDATIGTDLLSNTVATAGVTLSNVAIARDWTNTKGNMAATTVTVGGNWTNTIGNLTATGVTVDGYYTSAPDAQTTAASMENVIVRGAFSQLGGDLDLTGTNVLAYNTIPATPVVSDFIATGNVVDITNSTTTIGNLANATLNLAKESTDAVVFNVKGISSLASVEAYVGVNATYNAEGEVTGLEGNGQVGSPMILEGKLTTNANVVLAGHFSICGQIENKEDGVWTLAGFGVKKFIHAHAHANVTEFVNHGKVVVEDVTDATTVATVANVLMAADLYNTTTSTGILEWKGMTTLTDLAAVYAVSTGCYATDLHAQLDASTTEQFSADLNLSTKNIILSMDANYAGQFATGKKLFAKNLTVNSEAYNLTISGSVPATEYLVNVTEDINLNKLETSTGNPEVDLTSSISVDINVDNAVATNSYVIKNGLNMHYTGDYNKSGNAVNNNWVNDIPQKKI